MGYMRRFTLRIHNDSPHLMVFEEEKTVHGSYDESPLHTITPGALGQFSHSTCGLFTGTQGRIVYKVMNPPRGEARDQIQFYEFSWDMPFCGDNEFTDRYGDKDSATGTTMRKNFVRPADEGDNPTPMGEAEAIEADEVIVVVRFNGHLYWDVWPAGEKRPIGIPPNPDPKDIIVDPGTPTLARDADTRLDKVVYVGLNEPQDNLEACGLGASVPAAPPDRMSAVASALRADAPAFWARWKDKPTAEWVASIPSLPPEQANRLVDVLDAASRRVLLPDAYELAEMTDRPRYELRAVALLFAEAEREVAKDRACASPPHDAPVPDDAPLRRLVVSGHHSPSHGGYWSKLFYGHDRAVLHFDDLEALGSVFPAAVAQVDHVFLAACNAGHWKGHDKVDASWEIVPSLARIFPNLKTVWAYAGGGPTGPVAVDDLRAWELASRRGADVEEIVRASRDRRTIKAGGKTYAGFRSVVWVNGGDGLAPRLEGWS